jgi:5-oxopent-3-ene-1,2,5-tricarboxylate decarboxylase/2-hydroxyhepta-2,4-diene-1,7-dioate isomerase
MSVLDGPRRELRRILVGGMPEWVRVSDDGQELILGNGRRQAEASAVYLPPCDPTKILCIHLNYDSRRIEFGFSKPPRTPTYFQKPNTALNSHRGRLYRPADCKYLNYEGELAAVVGRPMRNVRPEEVWDYLAGFAPVNDVGAHDFRDTDAGSMLRVKGQDGFCPIGPGLVSGVDVRDAGLRTYRNGRLVQEGRVADMIFPIGYIFADLTRHITLLPGDVVLTGTPANSRPMDLGDLIEVEVDGLGRLSNTVAEAPAPAWQVGHQPTETDAVTKVALGGDWRPTAVPAGAPAD